MCRDGDNGFPETSGQDPRGTTDQRTSPCLPRVVELFEARKPHETRHQRNRWHGQVGEVSKGSAKLYVQPITARKKILRSRGVHINVQEGERVKRANRSWTPAQPARYSAVLGEKELQSYLVNEIQEVTACRASTSRQAIEVIVPDDAW